MSVRVIMAAAELPGSDPDADDLKDLDVMSYPPGLI